MAQLRAFNRLSGGWKYSVIGGLVSIPFTAASYLQTGSEISLSAVIIGGFFAGYLAEQRTKTSRGVGFRAGLVGAIPVLWMLFDALQAVVRLSNPLWFSAVLVVLLILVAVFAFSLAALGGELGARVGIWLAKRSGVQGGGPELAS